MALNDVMEYFQQYDKTTFRVVTCQGHVPTEEALLAFEEACGFQVPDEFAEFTLSPLGGLFMEVREALWPRADGHPGGLYGVKVFGIADNIPGWLDIRTQFDTMRAAGHSKLVPFLQVEGDRDCYCFNEAGEIIYWDHEDPDARKVVDSSFSEILLKELRDLEDRAKRKIAGEELDR
jgi:hypothetical protein